MQNVSTWHRTKGWAIKPCRRSCLNIAFRAALAVPSFADFDETAMAINGEKLETVRRVSRFRRFKGLTKFRESFNGYNCVNDGEKERRRDCEALERGRGKDQGERERGIVSTCEWFFKRCRIESISVCHLIVNVDAKLYTVRFLPCLIAKIQL